MQCWVCQKNAATVHISEILEGEVSETNLCRDCEQEREKSGLTLSTSSSSKHPLKTNQQKAVSIIDLGNEIRVQWGEGVSGKTLEEMVPKILRDLLSKKQSK